MMVQFGFNPTLWASAITSTIVLGTAASALAAPTQITGAEVVPTATGLELRLSTQGGDRPQVFAVPRGNSWVADVINTQLNLSSGDRFSVASPADGVSAITIETLDRNSVRITITGSGATPSAQLTTRTNALLTFGVTIGSGDNVAQIPNIGPGETAQPRNTPPRPSTNINDDVEVLVPNPEITINDNNQPTPIPRTAPAPPFLPRAVAPPLGDIAVSNLVPNIGGEVDLGTAQRVPRLVLRDAPAREVLSLLARAAGLNMAYIGGTGTASTGSRAATTTAAPSGAEGPTITLDIENEPVQDVFNYVLKLTQLEAVRQGRTILVGPELPQDTRNTIIRSLRINQTTAATVAAFLSAQGAETQQVVTRTTRTQQGTGVDTRILEETTTTIAPLAANTSATGAPLTLTGLSIVTDDRLNSVTLIGEPSLVELATSLTRQLDLRQRQVAVNVKVIDMTLTNGSSFSSSFSLGTGDAFLVNEEGSAALNYGDLAPANLTTANDSQLNRPLIDNPYADLPLGVNFDQSLVIPSAAGQGIQIVNGATGQVVGNIPAFSQQFTQSAVLTDNPLQTVLSLADGAQAGTLTFKDTNNNGIFDTTDTIDSFTPAVQGQVSQSLAEQILYPNDILLRLRAQIVSGNAKILTDPTLVVQESQSATVNITQKVLSNVTETAGTGDNSIPATNYEFEEVGLTVTVAVPRVDDNGFITMEVQPRITTPDANSIQTVPTRNGNVQISQVAARELNSGRIRLRDGQSLILAGIIQEQDVQNVTKFPLLGDIPIIGSLFRSTTSDRNRNEVIIVVTPQILDDSDTSNYGYSYTPSPEVQRVLDQQRP